MTEKYCVDCEYCFIDRGINYIVYECHSDNNLKSEEIGDLVTGRRIIKKQIVENCRELRYDETKCGTDGKWFKLSKKSKWSIFNL
jgi:hypothetical protein